MQPFIIEDAKLIFRNFGGKEGMYNREGDRNFAILLDDKLAELMAKDGWNVRWLKPREEGEPSNAYLQISVNFKGRPPQVVMITSRGRTNLAERDLELLDWADIAMADLMIDPYEWAVNGKTGIKAYLRSIFVTLEENPLDMKYADIKNSSEYENKKHRRFRDDASGEPSH